MPINRNTLVTEMCFHLGPNNQLNEERLLVVAERVISSLPADDDQYEAEALCKSLRDAAIQNKSLSLNTRDSLKKEKSYEREVEYYQDNNLSYWDDFIDNLSELCPTFGYTGLSSSNFGAMKINVADSIRVPCGSVQYGRTGFDGCSSYDK